jgi:Ribbon-helix-helix domain
MQVFTSSLPDPLFAALSEKATELKVPKNKIIEKALALYLEQLNKAAYIKSYRHMTADTDVMLLAEEGMQAYYSQLNSLDQDETR